MMYFTLAKITQKITQICLLQLYIADKTQLANLKLHLQLAGSIRLDHAEYRPVLWPKYHLAA